jgi:hypothetical protein
MPGENQPEPAAQVINHDACNHQDKGTGIELEIFLQEYCGHHSIERFLKTFRCALRTFKSLPELIGGKLGQGNVFAGYQQEFILYAGDAIVLVRLVLWAIIKFFGDLFGRPLNDDEERKKFSLAF